MSDIIQSNDEEFEEHIGCCHPQRGLHRLLALIFMCLLGFGSFFCYDMPAALENHMKEDFNISTAQYTMFYSSYSWPNVVCCFFGGFLIDKVFGIRLGSTLYSLLVVVGQLVFAFGAYIDSFIIMLMGRFVFGIGGESLAVAQNNYAVLWFKGKELNMVFGFQLSLSRVGSTVNMLLAETMYKFSETFGLVGYQTLGIVLLTAGITCIFSLLCSLILGFMDKRAERILNRRDPGACEDVRLSDVTKFGLSFWMIAVAVVTYYCSIFPFVSIAQDLFEKLYHLDKDAANRANCIVYTVSAFLSPLMGFLVDKSGRNVFWVFISFGLSGVCHVFVAYRIVDVHISMVLLGIAYSMVASALWPLIALVIPEYQLGTAYGMAQAVQNLGLALSTQVAGVIVDKYGYEVVEMFFVGNISVGMVVILCLWIYDNGRLGLLNMSATQRSIHDANKLAVESIERERMLGSQDNLSES